MISFVQKPYVWLETCLNPITCTHHSRAGTGDRRDETQSYNNCSHSRNIEVFDLQLGHAVSEMLTVLRFEY
jgi:hypothetical protein